MRRTKADDPYSFNVSVYDEFTNLQILLVSACLPLQCFSHSDSNCSWVWMFGGARSSSEAVDDAVRVGWWQ